MVPCPVTDSTAPALGRPHRAALPALHRLGSSTPAVSKSPPLRVPPQRGDLLRARVLPWRSWGHGPPLHPPLAVPLTVPFALPSPTHTLARAGAPDRQRRRPRREGRRTPRPRAPSQLGRPREPDHRAVECTERPASWRRPLLDQLGLGRRATEADRPQDEATPRASPRWAVARAIHLRVSPPCIHSYLPYYASYPPPNRNNHPCPARAFNDVGRRPSPRPGQQSRSKHA